MSTNISIDKDTLFKLETSADKMYNALQVLIKSEKLKCLLEVNDYQAYAQAKTAIKSYEDRLFHI